MNDLLTAIITISPIVILYFIKYIIKVVYKTTDHPFVCPKCGKTRPSHYLHKASGNCFLCNYNYDPTQNQPIL